MAEPCFGREACRHAPKYVVWSDYATKTDQFASQDRPLYACGYHLQRAVDYAARYTGEARIALYYDGK